MERVDGQLCVLIIYAFITDGICAFIPIASIVYLHQFKECIKL